MKIIAVMLAALVMLAGCSGKKTSEPEPEPVETAPDVETLDIDMDGKEAIAIDRDNFAWDIDGDGEAEKFYFDIIDNGDEAPNVMEICLYSGKYDMLSIDGGYGIKALAGIPEEGNRRIEMIYYTGTYYFSGFENRGYIRVEDGKLVMDRES